MLALTRRIGEEIVIGDPRKPLGIIRVVEIRGDKVRLAFDFPADVEVNRRELADQKARTPASPSTPGKALGKAPGKALENSSTSGKSPAAESILGAPPADDS